ncbi:hypothetical protein GEMRC1_002919 [Eukaryota sp. GEM-RC1]
MIGNDFTSISKYLDLTRQILARTEDRVGEYAKNHCKFAHAKLLELQGDFPSAVKLYKEIVIDFPSFVPAYLRLSSLDNGADTHHGLRWLKLGIYANPFNSDLRNEMGNFFMRKKEFEKAYEAFTNVQQIWNFEPYAFLALGNFALHTGRQSLMRRDGSSSKKWFDNAVQYYTKVIEFRKLNSFAALGIASVLGQLNHSAMALTLLTRIRESSPVIMDSNIDLWINMGHAHHGLKDFRSSVRCYDRAVTLLTSRTQPFSQSGKSFRDLAGEVCQFAAKVLASADEYTRALWYLTKGLKLCPHNLNFISDQAMIALIAVKQHLDTNKTIWKQRDEIDIDYEKLAKSSKRGTTLVKFAKQRCLFLAWLYQCAGSAELEGLDFGELYHHPVQKETAVNLLKYSKIRAKMIRAVATRAVRDVNINDSFYLQVKNEI